MSNQSIRLVFASLLALAGLLLGLGGIWLIVLGGSAFYLVQGLAFIAIAALIRAGNPLALWAYAALVLLTLAWAMLEVGLDWWQLVPRGDLTVALGVVLLVPWVARTVRSPQRCEGGREVATAFRFLFCSAVVLAPFDPLGSQVVPF